MLGFRIHVLLHPDLIQSALIDHSAELVKPDITRRVLGAVIGEGLLTAEGELWRSERRIVAASFTPAAVEAHRARFRQSGGRHRG